MAEYFGMILEEVDKANYDIIKEKAKIMYPDKKDTAKKNIFLGSERTKYQEMLLTSNWGTIVSLNQEI